MADVVPYQPDHSSYRKGATWWGRAFPYVDGEGDERMTHYGDWWDEPRLQRLTLWQGDAERALTLLMGDDAALTAAATARVVYDRTQAELRAEGIDFTWDVMQRRLRDARPLPEDGEAIAADVQRRVRARTALREAIGAWYDRTQDRRLLALHPGHPTEWPIAAVVEAALHDGDLLLRLARAGYVPDPGDLAPPDRRVTTREVRDPSQSAAAAQA